MGGKEKPPAGGGLLGATLKALFIPAKAGMKAKNQAMTRSVPRKDDP
jgi:hypothetical protein